MKTIHNIYHLKDNKFYYYLLMLIVLSFVYFTSPLKIVDHLKNNKSNNIVNKTTYNIGFNNFVNYLSKPISVNNNTYFGSGINLPDYSPITKNESVIFEQDYNIYDCSGIFSCINWSNNLKFNLLNNGFEAVPFKPISGFPFNDALINSSNHSFKNNPLFGKENGWKVNLLLKGFGKSDSYTKFSGTDLKVNGNKGFIEDDEMKIEYLNNEAGLKQNFIAKRRPVGEDKLKILLESNSDLFVSFSKDKIVYSEKNGKKVFEYSGLYVFDSNNKVLNSYFNQINNNEFSIIIDDSNAQYPITVDPISNSPDWTMTGNQETSSFGHSVSTAGDINGDGYSDLIVSAPLFDSGENDEGKVFVYYGSSSGLSNTPNWTAEGNQAIGNFGWSVSTAGDVNGDGYSDLIVSAPFFDSGETDEGKVFVYFGSSSGLSNTPNWTAEGNQVGGNFGFSVSTAGDVNGDGFSDVIIGANSFDSGETDEGKVFVYFGSTFGLSNTPNWTAEGNQVGGNFGYSVSTAGDVNGDGYSDVIIGAHTFDNGQSNEGRAFVYFGSLLGLSVSPNWFDESNQTGAKFGISVSTAGDVNGDGYSDIVVGSYQFSNGQSNEGRAFVYYGSAVGLPSSPSWITESNQAEAYLGCQVFTAGDVNGDGYSDVLVGAGNYSNDQLNEGRAFLYYGSSSGLSSSPDWFSESNNTYSYFGFSLSTAGDVNGDGFSDVIIGARSFYVGVVNYGKVFLFLGSARLLSNSASFSAISESQNTIQFADKCTTAGDVNGDGYSDFMFNSPFWNDGYGKVYLFYGSSQGISQNADWTAIGNLSLEQFGSSISTAGDVNGDGFSDIIISSAFYSNGEYVEGKVSVFYGSLLGLSSSPNWSFESNLPYLYLGTSVSTAGDVNGDGFSDILVSSTMQNGLVYCFYGSSSGLPSTPSKTIIGDQNGSSFGYSVCSAGDVNGDGFSDILVGAHDYNNGQLGEGKVFCYYGSDTGLSSVSNWSAESNQSQARFGISVSSAGDVNGDGFSDVIIGASLFDNGQVNEGRVFVFHGSLSGLSLNPNWISENNQPNSLYGLRVSSAGDVNGDGFSDVLISTPYFVYRGDQFGQVYCFHGSSSGLSGTVNWSVMPDRELSNFGVSISCAGDINGDGFSDVLVGAPDYWNNSTLTSGAIFGYLGNTSGGRKGNVSQLKYGSNVLIGEGGYSNSIGQVKLSQFSYGFSGRTSGKLVWEIKENGIPLNKINYTGYTGIQSGYSDFGQNGISLSENISGLVPSKGYKWRTRLMYSKSSNPYQVFGPWKYYYSSKPSFPVSFKANVNLESKINLFITLQGLYNGTFHNLKDTVKVYLRNFSNPQIIVDSNICIIDSLSMMGSFVLNNAQTGDYYLSINHRNSLEVWSSALPFHFVKNHFNNYNFSSSQGNTFGNNSILIGNKWCVYSGDVNKDGWIDLVDMALIDNDVNQFSYGWLNTDLNGDGLVDAADLSIVDNNNSNFIYSITPINRSLKNNFYKTNKINNKKL